MTPALKPALTIEIRKEHIVKIPVLVAALAAAMLAGLSLIFFVL